MPSQTTNRTWLITGAGRGLGLAFATAALAAGDQVVAGARRVESLSGLVAAHGDAVLAVQLDVSNDDDPAAAVVEAMARFGRVDVLVNNAGYGLSGAVEELAISELREQLEVNLFGLLRCTQAVLPVMRAQGSGHIVQLSSLGGVVGLPNVGGYAASKWAVEGLSESLAAEVKGFGIHVTILEPGPFRSDWNGTSMRRAVPLSAYDDLLAGRRAQHSGEFAHTQPGDPALAAQALLRVVNSAHPPRRLLLGAQAADLAPAAYRERLAEWMEWDDVARATDFAGQPEPGG